MDKHHAHAIPLADMLLARLILSLETVTGVDSLDPELLEVYAYEPVDDRPVTVN